MMRNSTLGIFLFQALFFWHTSGTLNAGNPCDDRPLGGQAEAAQPTPYLQPISRIDDTLITKYFDKNKDAFEFVSPQGALNTMAQLCAEAKAEFSEGWKEERFLELFEQDDGIVKTEINYTNFKTAIFVYFGWIKSKNQSK